jgi:hypothetical protein
MTGPSPVRPGNAQFAPVAATVRLGHLIFQTKRWNEAIRMADLKGAVAIARHYHAGSVRAAKRRSFAGQSPLPLYGSASGGVGATGVPSLLRSSSRQSPTPIFPQQDERCDER